MDEVNGAPGLAALGGPGPDSAPIGRAVSPSEAMRWAIREGAKGVGRVAPNPLVGCSIVDREGLLLAVGHHRRVGGPHAEIEALSQVVDRSRLQGATAYVTLEPCAHQGRTGPCAKALAELPIASVVYAVEDPNPLVSGAGARILREAGVLARELSACSEIFDRGELIADAEDLAEVFLFNARARRPFVSLKVASTLDGQIALSTGESRWITGEASRARAHALRAGHDAVLIGRRTFEADDPALNIRAAGLSDVVNSVIVLDPRGETLARLPSSRMAKVRPLYQVITVVGDAPETAKAAALAENAGVRVLRASVGAEGSFEPGPLLDVLWTAGIRSILVEGGAGAIASFVRAGAFQRFHAFIAPLMLGARTGLSWSSGFGFSSLSDGARLVRLRGEFLGEDFYLTGRSAKRANPSLPSDPTLK